MPSSPGEGVPADEAEAVAGQEGLEPLLGHEGLAMAISPVLHHSVLKPLIRQIGVVGGDDLELSQV